MKNVFALVLLAAAFLLSAASPGTVTLIKDGKAQFRLVVPNKKDLGTRIMTKTFREALREAAGVNVEVVTEDKLAEAKGKLINLHLGNGMYAKSQGLQMPGPNGFIIAFPNAENIVIAGVSICGAEFNTLDGVVWFLEQYLGVRYLLPGDIGTHIPKLQGDWTVPVKSITKIPAIFARQYSGVHGQAYLPQEHIEQDGALDWAFRMSMNISNSLKLSHNVGYLLDPEKYEKTHPEFFPLINGKRVFPPRTYNSWKMMSWEPCYTADGVAEAAAQAVIEHFQKNPELYSCSLSCNDSANICQCEKCRKVNAKLPQGSESQSYYEWVCRVVDIVRKEYPDRYFGILNYWPTKELPSGVKLDSHVIPIVCEDLKFDVDPECRAKLEKKLAQWKQIASSIGWWDYAFEGAYLVPAYNAHYLAGMLKNLYKNYNLRVYTCELTPGRHLKNAPEIYMTMKLLWDIDRDPDEILDEWFECAVGKEAAPYFKKYFAIWENFWTNKIPQTTWFRSRIGTPFLQRADSDYLDALAYEDVVQAYENMQKVVELAPAGKEKQRAEFFMNNFTLYANTYLLPYLNTRKAKDELKATKGKLLKHYAWDDGPGNWIPWQLPGTSAVLSHDKNIGYRQKGCLGTDFKASVATSMVWFRRPLEFELNPGKNYRITVWCKGTGLAEKDRVRMRLDFPVKSEYQKDPRFNVECGLHLASPVSGKDLKDGKWHQLECVVAVPRTAWNHIAGVNCQLEVDTRQANGRAWFDDLKVEEILESVKNYPELHYVPPRAEESVFIDPETKQKLGPELVVDGDMEADDMAAWLTNVKPKIKEKSTQFRHSGKQSLHIVSQNFGDGVFQVIKPYHLRGLYRIPYKGIEKGKRYRVQLWYKNMDINGWEDIRLAGCGLKEPMKSTDTEWHKVVYQVTAVDPPYTDFVTIGYGSKTGDVYIDDVSIREILDKK